VKTLGTESPGLLGDLFRALQLDEVGSDLGFLPNLQVTVSMQICQWKTIYLPRLWILVESWVALSSSYDGIKLYHGIIFMDILS
jgi:hypothetical protein